MLIGYARVSTVGQTLEGQEATLKANGVEKIYSEKESGAKTGRKELDKALKALSKGDVLVVTKIDRLARSTRDLHNFISDLTAKGVGFKSINDHTIDTTTPNGKFMLSILAAVAELERDMILTRTNEGRIRARARGVRFGRHLKLKEPARAEVVRMLSEGKTQREVAKIFSVSQQTIMRAGRQ